jgi:hypothetical protein
MRGSTPRWLSIRKWGSPFFLSNSGSVRTDRVLHDRPRFFAQYFHHRRTLRPRGWRVHSRTSGEPRKLQFEPSHSRKDIRRPSALTGVHGSARGHSDTEVRRRKPPGRQRVLARARAGNHDVRRRCRGGSNSDHRRGRDSGCDGGCRVRGQTGRRRGRLQGKVSDRDRTRGSPRGFRSGGGSSSILAGPTRECRPRSGARGPRIAA